MPLPSFPNSASPTSSGSQGSCEDVPVQAGQPELPGTSPVVQRSGASDPVWKAQLAEAIHDPRELCRVLELPPQFAETILTVVKEFPLLLPRTVLPRIRPGDLNDPLLRQFLPLPQEAETRAGFETDPLCERSACAAPGILAKYQGRILILTTPACPVHCRYCFRRHFPYAETLEQSPPASPPAGVENHPPRDRLPETTRRYLERAADCQEVILSGGEPLLLDDDRLGKLFSQLAQIAHLKRIRIHTRLPVVIPQRVTDQLLEVLRGCRLTKAVVLHINHPQEIDAGVAEALGKLRESGGVLLVQSVLLAGVNDSADVLATLYEKLADLGVLPYYLHQLDRVRGAQHFEVPVGRGREIVAELRRRLPGYLVPRYVQEVPGAAAKVPLD